MAAHGFDITVEEFFGDAATTTAEPQTADVWQDIDTEIDAAFEAAYEDALEAPVDSEAAERIESLESIIEQLASNLANADMDKAALNATITELNNVLRKKDGLIDFLQQSLSDLMPLVRAPERPLNAWELP